MPTQTTKPKQSHTHTHTKTFRLRLQMARIQNAQICDTTDTQCPPSIFHVIRLIYEYVSANNTIKYGNYGFSVSISICILRKQLCKHTYHGICSVVGNCDCEFGVCGKVTLVPFVSSTIFDEFQCAMRINDDMHCIRSVEFAIDLQNAAL